jgi:hypothetical protein
MLKYLLLLCCLFSENLLAQENSNEATSKITNALEEYFSLEREAIHLHLNKSTFVTNEKVWYQGYIINRKTKKPFFTTNVYVVLYDEKGNQISEKLIFAYNGVFSGVIDLNEKMHSGRYTLQVYTNWMNNFSENESSVYDINVVNPAEGIKDYYQIEKESLALSLNPEGTNFINGIKNTVGISIKDCRGNAPKNLLATVQNSKGETIKTVPLSDSGFGKFEVAPDDDFEKVTVTYLDKTITTSISNNQSMGFGIEINNLSVKDQTFLKIKTNLATISSLKNQKVYLVVHQDSQHFIFELANNENNLEQTIALENKTLFNGINTIRIIDSNLTEWANRVFYNSPKKEVSVTVIKNYRKEDKIGFTGYYPMPNTIFSVTVLPSNTKSLSDNYSIIAGLGINPYLSEPLNNANYYLSESNRIKEYELDLFLLNQPKLKYQWENIKTIKPESNFSFDIGLQLKGTISPNIKNKPNHKVKISSFKDQIIKTTEVDNNGQYVFENLILTDSTRLVMSVLKLPTFEEVDGKISYQLFNRRKPFYKPFKPNVSCKEIVAEQLTAGSDLPLFVEKAIALKEVVIEKKLTYAKAIGNNFLRGYKVDEIMEGIDLLSFIERNGFIVQRDLGEVNIYSRISNSMNSDRPRPQIIIDGRVAFDQLELTSMRMLDFDEIYLSPNAIVPGMQNFSGVIKVYTKKGFKPNKIKANPNDVIIKEAFAPYPGFSNTNYNSTNNTGFDYYGLIEWIPLLNVNDEGQIMFKITDYNKTDVKAIIEGVSPEGILIHEEVMLKMK